MQYANLIFFAKAVGATNVVQKPFQNFQNIIFRANAKTMD